LTEAADVPAVWDDVAMSVDAWLQTAPVGAPIPDDELTALRHDLEDSVASSLRAVHDHLHPDLFPIRMPKSRLAHLQRCPRSALAHFDEPDRDLTGVAALRGTALDHFVAHQLVAGRVREPVADLASMLIAAGDHASLEVLRALDPVEAAELLDPLAAAVAESWAGIDPSWAPRVQSRASVVLAERRCICSGDVDVELGGPTTSRPGVLVEVKSGRAAATHQDEVYLYALLVALRDGVAPGLAARWYPGAPPSGLPVTLGVLEAAFGRLEDSVRHWLGLLAGDTPRESPGAWCSWCPDRSVCPSAATGADDGR
jgi:hypothetical protein